MTKKSGFKVDVNCALCSGVDNEQHVHSSYSEKIDSNGVAYVVCQTTNKRININQYTLVRRYKVEG